MSEDGGTDIKRDSGNTREFSQQENRIKTIQDLKIYRIIGLQVQTR